jgi:integrase
MSVFLNGNTYWFEFTFNGVRHRRSCKTSNQEVAEKIEREHRRSLELGQVGLLDQRRAKQKLFSTEVKEYIELMQPHWKKKTQNLHNTSLPKVLEFFGKMVLTDITSNTIQQYQVHRKSQLTKKGTEPSNRTVNSELALVRQLLTHHKLWYQLKEGTKLKMLKQNEDVGVALDEDELQRLLKSCKESINRSLYPAVLLSVFTGMRSFELRNLKWQQIDLLKATLTVGTSKSDAGTGRIINLSTQALDLIKNWRGNFPNVEPAHYVFPSELYAGKTLWKTCPEVPVTSFFESWDTARQRAGVKCRWHDLRHSCVSILATEGVSRPTLKALFGWMSDKMIDRYSHARAQERKIAVQHVDKFMDNMMKLESIQ